MNWKKVLGTAAKCLTFLIVLGIPLFYLQIFALLGVFPLYVAQVLPFVGISLLLAVEAEATGLLKRQWSKRMWLAVLGVFVLSAAWIGRGMYINSIPTVDDRDLLLWKYEPFREGTLAVELEEPSTLRFTNADQKPRLDGATALYPVYSAFVQAVYPEREYNWYDEGGQVACSGTNDAYEWLCLRQTDIIFAAAPSQNQIDRAHELGMELYLTPIGREAFVFFVNSKNPVTNLTVEQVQGIYTGEITNWKQVGGENRSILAYQRQANSGSQSALLRLMDGLPLAEPKEEQVIGGMGGIIERVASYRNFRNAIGFSFRYYSTEMVQNGDIRLLSLNGVEPTKQTIRDGSYPISSYFYAVTAGPIGEAAPEETDEAIAMFLEWILSDQGQELIEETGYVPLT